MLLQTVRCGLATCQLSHLSSMSCCRLARRFWWCESLIRAWENVVINMVAEAQSQQHAQWLCLIQVMIKGARGGQSSLDVESATEW